ncbi:MAG: 16S rRNA (adenine(1518)-N(6)/adenine(1519)-N(6))-dimethyltransferase RsmA [Nitrospirota bacterium]|nr:16S rRNA (adenine(1518)-N(6)/adenine(1519)-N(6))-dimethyltransferase RsmA [Nitrospirota bacterium]
MQVSPKKSLGQNFLTDPNYVHKIVDAAEVGPQDRILEIGPGLGHLTRELARRAGTVLAIELDNRVIPHLREEFAAATNVEILEADALLFPYDGLQGTWKVVANLPYYISTPLVQKLLSMKQLFTSLTIMVQKEVAERIVASPGGKDYGVLSIQVQYTAKPRIAFVVPSGAFTPRPKVDSAVMVLTPRPAPAVAVVNEEFFFRLVKAAFSQRRKTLRNSLAQLGLDSAALKNAEQRSGIDLSRRAETLTIEEFGILAGLLYH